MCEDILLLTLLIRGVKSKFIYHQLRLDKRYLIKDCIGLMNLYGNYQAKITDIKLLHLGKEVIIC